MAEPPRILRQRLEEGFDADGKPFSRIAVDFKVGDDGPFTERFPATGFDGQTVHRTLESFAAQLRKARGELF